MTPEDLKAARELCEKALADDQLRRSVVEAIDDEVGGQRENEARRVIVEITRRRLDREPLLAKHGLQLLAEVERLAQFEECFIDQTAEVVRLQARQDELLALVAKLSQTVPLESEVADALNQRGVMLAEIGTLKAERVEVNIALAEMKSALAEALDIADFHIAILCNPPSTAGDRIAALRKLLDAFPTVTP